MIVGFARTLYLNYSNQLWDSPWLGLNLYGANAYTNGHFNLLRGLIYFDCTPLHSCFGQVHKYINS